MGDPTTSDAANAPVFKFFISAGEVEEFNVASIEGHEAISQLFHYTLLLARRGGEETVEPADMIGKACTITFVLNADDGSDGHPDAPDTVARYVNGIVKRFEQISEGTLFSYFEVEVVPAFWLLTQRRNFRIFQQKNVEDIVTQVLTDGGMTTDSFRFALTRDYAAREYCAQYRESDGDFARRLLEEEGIQFFFEHTETGHVMVIGDSAEVNKPVAGEAELDFRETSGMVSGEHVPHFRIGCEVRPGLSKNQAYNFRQPGTRVKGEKAASDYASLEHYDFGRVYVSREGAGSSYSQAADKDAKTDAVAAALSENRLEALRATMEQGEGKTNCRRFIAGSTFDLAERFEDETPTYLLTRLRVTGVTPEFMHPEAGAAVERPVFLAEFYCIPHATVFRPPQLIPRPVAAGAETGIVVGPSGEEIYTDEFGRIKVLFSAYREAPYDETASFWIRVCQGWAGGQYGMFFLPRVGHEVLVTFLGGNPDEPIVTGCLHNGDHKPPYTLPDNKTISTIRTSSTPGGGGANELRFEDKAGSEQVFLHSQKDLHIRALGARVQSVGGGAHDRIGGERREFVCGDISLEGEGEQAIKIGGDRSLDVVGSIHQAVGVDFMHESSGGTFLAAGGDATLSAGMGVTIEAGTGLELKCGGSSIVLSPGGIFITGPLVNINSGSGPPGPSGSTPSPVAPAEPAGADEVTPGEDTSYTGTAETPEPVEPPETTAPAAGEGEETEEPEEGTWAELELNDDEGNHIPGAQFIILLADGQTIEGRTDVNGQRRVKLPPGTADYDVQWPDYGEDWDQE